MPADFTGQNMSFVVGGYHDYPKFQDKTSGQVFSFDIPGKPDPMEKPFDIVDMQSKEKFGIILLGERYFIDRLIQGYDSKLPDILSHIPNLQTDQVQGITHRSLKSGRNRKILVS
ncbi:MAG TPA: hypothetical protein VEL31_05160 [Ktedonobacteraceae bacterium]|nr:hypothetical protein [Ktedonobacteraceae bacterium]